jgi:hypothetical protein
MICKFVAVQDIYLHRYLTGAGLMCGESRGKSNKKIEYFA